MQPEVSQRGAFKVYRHDGLELWCGDFFALRKDDVSDCAGFYDRAAVIALPPAMRERYAALLNDCMPQGCKGLMITLDYDQQRLDGPPFSVPDQEVQRLFATWQPKTLEAWDVIEQSPKFVQAGMKTLFERVYRLQR
ncbi:Thiopurine S-methyltransferase [compost metagenome]